MIPERANKGNKLTVILKGTAKESSNRGGKDPRGVQGNKPFVKTLGRGNETLRKDSTHLILNPDEKGRSKNEETSKKN